MERVYQNWKKKSPSAEAEGPEFLSGTYAPAGNGAKNFASLAPR